jgi:hypothetical protein
METLPKDISEYLRLYANEMTERIVQQFPPLYQPGDPIWPSVERLRRRPYPSQSDTPRGAGGLMSWAVSKTAGPWV